AKGVPINNLIDVGGNERVTAVFIRPESETEAHYMLMVTKNGYIKKTALREYANVRRNGLIAINLQEGDELDWVTPTSGKDEIIIATTLGKAIRFGESEVRAMGRDTQGVIGIKLGKGDTVAGMGTVTGEGDVLVVTERGYGKRTPVAEYPMHHRAGQGVSSFGPWLLVLGAGVILVEGAVAGVWSVRLVRQGRALSARLERERGFVRADVARLRETLEETRRLWEPWRRALRRLRHPLVAALLASFWRQAERPRGDEIGRAHV